MPCTCCHVALYVYTILLQVTCIVCTCTYVRTLCAVSDASCMSTTNTISVFAFNECILLRESIVFLCFLPDSKLNTPTDHLQTTPTKQLETTPTSFLIATPTEPLQATPTDPLLTTPTLNELNRQVIPHICLDWQSVGHHLEVDPSMMKVIDDYHDDVEKCCRTMLTRWLSHDEGTGGAPRLWRTVLKALKNVRYTSLVGDVERTLFEHQ